MSDTPRTRSIHAQARTAAVLRLLGALLCMGGVALMAGSEVYVLLQRTAVEHAHYAACVAPFDRGPESILPGEDITGPQQDICLAPAALALLVIGVRSLLENSPGIASPAATLLGIGGVCAVLFPSSMFGPLAPGCPIVLAGRAEPLFWLGLLGGLVGSIVLSRTTRYRPLRLGDA